MGPATSRPREAGSGTVGPVAAGRAAVVGGASTTFPRRTESFQTTALTTVRDCETAVCRSCKQLDTWSPASLRTGPAGAPCPATDPHLDHQAVQLGQRRDLAPPAPRVPPLVTDQRNIVARTSAWFEISRSTPYRVRRSSGHIKPDVAQ